MRVPTSDIFAAVAGVTVQLSNDTEHAHAVAFGVGGRLEDAKNEELVCGQDGKDVVFALLCEGVLGRVALPYCCERRVKSLLGVTVDPSGEIVTIPN